jgi:hypothetical protein
MAKTRSLVAAVTSVLCERGLTVPRANLVAWMGMAAISYAVAAWFDDSSIDLGEHIIRAFQEAGDLSRGKRRTQRDQKKGKTGLSKL